MTIKIIKEKITKEELKKIAQENYGDMVKAVVDIEKEIIAIGGELHADANELLIEKENSNQKNVWGINIYPEESKEKLIEFDSLINIRPSANNRSMGVENKETREKIKQIVDKLIK